MIIFRDDGIKKSTWDYYMRNWVDLFEAYVKKGGVLIDNLISAYHNSDPNFCHYQDTPGPFGIATVQDYDGQASNEVPGHIFQMNKPSVIDGGSRCYASTMPDHSLMLEKGKDSIKPVVMWLEIVGCTENCRYCDYDSVLLPHVDPGKAIVEGQCDECMYGYYINQGSNICKECITDCKLCIDDVRCQGCYGGKFVAPTLDECLISCPTGTYSNSGICNGVCSNGCRKCSSDLVCTSCLVGYYLDTNVCMPCMSGCSVCSGSQICIECTPPKVRKLDGTVCLDECPVTYFEQTSGTCDGRCLANCDKCIGTNTCQKCSDGSYLHYNHASCDASCAPGYFPTAEFTCEPCTLNCQTCTNSSICLECNYGYFMTADRTLCDLSCPASKFPISGVCSGNCLPGCNRCSSADSCSQCNSGLSYFTDGSYVECVSSCSSKGNYFKASDGVCYPCVEECSPCVDPYCQYCGPDRFFVASCSGCSEDCVQCLESCDPIPDNDNDDDSTAADDNDDDDDDSTAADDDNNDDDDQEEEDDEKKKKSTVKTVAIVASLAGGTCLLLIVLAGIAFVIIMAVSNSARQTVTTIVYSVVKKNPNPNDSASSSNSSRGVPMVEVPLRNANDPHSSERFDSVQ